MSEAESAPPAGGTPVAGLPPSVTFAEATRVWAEVGLNSFGGPAGQIAVMHRELVDERRWLSERRFLHALNYCMVLPGPEAQQLATYIGWLMHGVRGGAVAGSLFVLPGFVVMMVLSVIYAVYGDVDWVSGVLFGLRAAVVAIVIQALIRIGSRTLRTPFLSLLAGAAFVALFALSVPFPVVIAAAALLGWLGGRFRPAWLAAPDPAQDGPDAQRQAHLLAEDEVVAPGAGRRAILAAAACLVLWLAPVLALVVTLGTEHVFTQEALLFSKTAVITFGGAYAVLSYVSAQAVGVYGWITADDMTAGLGLAETTPGPLIMVVQFVGFLAAYNNPGSLPPLLAGVIGATITVWVTFVPCFLFIFAGASSVERLRHSRPLHNALSAIGAAIVGVIANLATWFATTTLFSRTTSYTYGPVSVTVPDLTSVQWAAVAITVVAIALTFRVRASTPRVLAACAGIGLVMALTGRI